MKYNEYIENIMFLRPNVKLDGVYMERHHIIPRCMNGSNDENNLIYLTPEEHYIAHKLLAEENKDNRQLQCAFWRMCHAKTNIYVPPSKEINEAKKRWCKSMSEMKYKKCICLETLKVFNSLKECANYYNTTLKNISRVCKDKTRSWNKLHFDYYEPELHTIEYYKHELAKRIKRRKIAQKPSLEKIKKATLSKLGKPRYDMQGSNNIKARKVYCTDLDKVFNTITDAAKYIGTTSQNICSVCSKRCYRTKGYHFEYYNGDNK